jgi:hypothetical protein
MPLAHPIPQGTSGRFDGYIGYVGTNRELHLPAPPPPMTPKARYALRRVAKVWATVAVIEALLWWMLYRGSFYRPLWGPPAVLVLAGGVVGTLHALRVRNRERRGKGDGDRRDGDRREPADQPSLQARR